jgi:Predicted dinucleotide-binding enzymes
MDLENIMADIMNIGVIAILGGTGKEGKGLAYQWAKKGHQVIIGSRLLEKAQAAAEEINQKTRSFDLPAGLRDGKWRSG